MTKTTGTIANALMIGMLALLSLFMFVDRDTMIAVANGPVMTVIGLLIGIFGSHRARSRKN